jgi:hypothetical protein
MLAQESDYVGNPIRCDQCQTKYDITDWLSFSTNFGADAIFIEVHT